MSLTRCQEWWHIFKTEFKWSQDYTIYKSDGPQATPIHKSTTRESPDSLPTYSEACFDVAEVGFWIDHSNYWNSNSWLRINQSICLLFWRQVRMHLRHSGHRSVRFPARTCKITNSYKGSLPEEVKWQFQTIQKTSSKTHVRASRWKSHILMQFINLHSFSNQSYSFKIKSMFMTYTFSIDLSQMYKYLMIALWHPQWTHQTYLECHIDDILNKW